MSAITLSGYPGSTGVVTWTDHGHPGYGLAYLILNGQGHGLKWNDTTQGNSHTVTFCIPWENVQTFRTYMLRTLVTSGSSLIQVAPCQSPYVSQFPNTYATAISGVGDGQDANITDSRLFKDLIVDVTFSTLTWNPNTSNPFYEISYAGSADYDTVPDSAMSFVTSGEKIDHDAGVLVGQLAINITFYLIPNINTFISTCMGLKGKVSSATVTIDGFTYPAGTLLFPTFGLQKAVDSNGNVTGNAVVTILQRDIPWNSGITSAAAVDTITPAPYSTADLNGIFSA